MAKQIEFWTLLRLTQEYISQHYLASEDTFRNPTCEGCKELVRTFKRRKSDDTYNEQRRERRKREREKKG